jgi:carboxymethylenebutenolidase
MIEVNAMPIYDPDHVEYSITSGHIQIVMDDGTQLPAYWAHPMFGRRFPGAVIIHDWWGLTGMVRRIANLFAQMGHYVIVPDLFDGLEAASPQEAMRLVESLDQNGYTRVDTALTVLENHHMCNASVAAVGVGLGGSLAFEAAIRRDDLEAAVAYGGFPARYLGKFKNAHAPIYAFFGQEEPHIKQAEIDRLIKELRHTPLKDEHRVEQVPEIGHEFFSEKLTESQRERSRKVLKKTFEFLDDHLEGPSHPPRRPVY